MDTKNVAKAITLSATSLEGQLLEVLDALLEEQRNPEANPDRLERISYSLNPQTKIVGFSGTLPVDVEYRDDRFVPIAKDLFAPPAPIPAKP